ncbi:D-alanine--D-alanine ligase [Candidatus Nomurabacteria bacterium]|nr:D-alanine--D-alanine ligase [Candidatus Nomurabacteria bacterium]
MSRKTVLLLFGGQSPEHDVSIMSARNVYAAMDNEKYHVLLGYIDSHGKWWMMKSWNDDLSQHGGKQLVAVPGMGSFVTYPGSDVVHVDVIFPVLHGENGEDGSIQGLAKLLHIPVVGCGVAASAVCMDKVLAKQILCGKDIMVTPWVELRRGDAIDKILIERELGNDIFVKPVSGGSSVGVSHVTDFSELESACEKAWKYSDGLLLEKTIYGRELEVAVLGENNHAKASDVGEIVSSDDKFYDYDEKYTDNSSARINTEADLPNEIRESIRDSALTIYRTLGCSGMARVDFLYDGETVYFNEVNTIPGFTSVSMYPKLWQAEGVKYPELIDKLIKFAV